MANSFGRVFRAIRGHRRAANCAGRHGQPQYSPLPELLESRWLPSTAAPAVQMISATTVNSKSVTIEYQVNSTPDSSAPLQFGIYRSSDGQFNSSDSLVQSFTPVAPGTATGATLDQSGQAATAPGVHTLTIPLSQGLPPFPEKPYVVVVADPSQATATAGAAQTASFRVYTIGIVTHGGIQDTSWKHGPPWEITTAFMMKHEGYDAVIPYNWVNESSTPGDAIKQSPILAAMIMRTASQFPAGAPVDLDFIGHSEGTVVNTYALVKLENELTPEMQAGYIEDTLLDPHAANENMPGQQMSFNGALAGIASMIVNDYQGEANDPPPFVPSIVDEAQVFFQHSHATPGAIYNLWGQVPVKSDGPLVHYYNLTDMGATHSGDTGVNYWFRDFIAPTLGDQAPLVTELQLNGQIDSAVTATAAPSAADADVAGARAQARNSARADREYGPAQVVTTSQPEISGTAAPGSLVRLGLSPAAKPWKLTLAGVTTANSSGQWTLTPTHPLRDGQYRVLVASFSRSLRTRPGLGIVPTQPLGRMVVE
jgi:Bacterial Ig-like domain